MKIKILADASLPSLHAYFPPPFEVTCYKTHDIPKVMQDHAILLCRSTLKVDSALLQHADLSYIATASSGIDHIDTQLLIARAISLIDAKGSNAGAVADYVLSCLAYLDVTQQLSGKTIGIIGMGHVGSIVAMRLRKLGFHTVCYDPPRAARDATFKSAALSDLYQCDLLSVHANLHHSAPHATYDLIDHHFLSKLKPGTTILNAARGGIVNEAALIKFSATIKYCTDVYLNEPDINPMIPTIATLCTPHIAGHSIEAKSNAMAKISYRLHQAYTLRPVVKEKRQDSNSTLYATNWQSWALSLYDPLQETRVLKKEKNSLKDLFVSLRQAHQYRHDFMYTPGR